MPVLWCKSPHDSENLHTNRHLRIKEFVLAFSLHSVSFSLVTSTCSLSLSNCDTAFATNSVSVKDPISGYMWQHNLKMKLLRFTSQDISLTGSLMLCSWTCSISFCVITVSTVQLQTVQFVQYFYRKCAVLLYSWTCSNSLGVINGNTVQLQTLHYLQYLYRKCAVLCCCAAEHVSVTSVLLL